VPLTDLNRVTEAIMFVLRTRVAEVLAGSGALTINTTAAPPDDVAEPESDNVLSFFLFHIMEDPYFKNAPPPTKGANAPEVAQAPMGLNLFYVMTAHHGAATTANDNFLRQQLIFGGALKVLHDFPAITQNTVVGPTNTNVFEFAGIDPGNVIEIIYRPLTPEDSISFWSSEQEMVTRLSAYYEVRVIFLRPEPPRLASAGIVLNLGAYVFTDGSPQLSRSVSRIGFVLPVAIGTLPAPIELSPARVALLNQDGAPLVPPLPASALDNNVLDLEGVGLARDETTLLLSSTRWVAAGNPSGTLAVTRADNADWYADGITADRLVRLRVRPQLDVGATSFDVLPGTYAARLRVSRIIDPPGPALARSLDTVSNAIGLLITPQIHELSALPPGPDASLTIVGDYLLDDGVTVELFIAGVAFTLVTTAPVAGEFRIVAPGGTEIELVLTSALDAALVVSNPLPLRLVVNGVDAPPAWLERA
jgi:hypothetical protein